MNAILSLNTIKKLGGREVALVRAGQKRVLHFKRERRLRSDGRIKTVKGIRNLREFHEDFWKVVDVKENTQCWLFTGKWECEAGHGIIRVPGPASTRHGKAAHRVAWESFYGPIQNGVCVLHKCDTPKCCNPYHLFLGTQLENMQDKVKKGRHIPGILKCSKLNPQLVLEIRRMKSEGMNGKEIHDKIKVKTAVSYSAIRKVISPNPNWRFVK